MRNGFLYYENGRPERISMRKAYRMFQTEVSEEQKNQETTFSTWLFEMIKMQIFLLTYDSGSLMPGSYFLLWRESGSQFDRKMIFIFFKEFPGNTIVQRSG